MIANALIALPEIWECGITIDPLAAENLPVHPAQIANLNKEQTLQTFLWRLLSC
jgi:hypothetical protein